MSEILYRHRPLALLAAALLAQVMLLAFQIKREHDVRLIRYWAVTLLTPVERAGTWSFSKVGGVWRGYIDLHNARAENERLRSEVQRLQMRNRELEGRAAEDQRLAALLNFRETHPEVPMLAAQVIGASADPTSHTLFINRGEHDHIRRNMGVMTPDGVVGKIVEVFPSSAQVLLINDKESGVGALLVTTRTHGIIKGTGDPEPRMDYVENTASVQPGEAIATSGEDRIFPKDVPIGTVESSKQGNPFQTIYIQPAAHLDRIEEVLILLTQQEFAPKKSEETASASSKSAASSSPKPAANPAPASRPPPKPPAAKPAAIPD
jgi:rod shape-determining protein MreC